MNVAVSPYHLTTREVPAMACLLLGTRVVTVLPASRTGQDEREARSAALSVPGFARFMESWQWSAPLWNEGVLSSGTGADDPVADVLAVHARIERDDRLASLRAFVRADAFEDERAYLDRIGRDILKGGPDPGISVPVAAGLDRFAARHGLIVARAHPASMAQQEEMRLSRRVFGLALPVLVQADAERVVMAREVLGEVLDELRGAMGRVAGEAAEQGSGLNAAVNELELAGRMYAETFHAARANLIRSVSRDELRVIDGTVAMTGVVLPGDAALRSSVAAAQEVIGGRRKPLGNDRAEPVALPTPYDAGEGAAVVSIVFKVMGSGGRSR